jgi:hypothetical protein
VPAPLACAAEEVDSLEVLPIDPASVTSVSASLDDLQAARLTSAKPITTDFIRFLMGIMPIDPLRFYTLCRKQHVLIGINRRNREKLARNIDS